MIKCSVGLGQLACFRFDEILREFHFFGKNDNVKLVPEEKLREGFIKEENALAMFPLAHHDPAPFLTCKGEEEKVSLNPVLCESRSCKLWHSNASSSFFH